MTAREFPAAAPPPPARRGRMICESCGHGYAPAAAACPWCGASPMFAHMSDAAVPCDTECYRDYWLCMLDTSDGVIAFETFAGHPLDIAGLKRALSRYIVVTFNGWHYDMPLIALALAGCDCVTLKAASDAIIRDGLMSWQLLDRFGVAPLDWIDHIDLFNVAPGADSLKMYGAKMHSRRLQDLPYDPDEVITWPKRLALREYCSNDLTTTADLWRTFPAQIALREAMSAEYGVDLRSKSDAQIAEAVMKSLLPFKPETPSIPAGTQFYYRPPAWLAYRTTVMRQMLARVVSSPFYVTPKGGVAPAYDNHLVDWGDKAVRLDVHGQWVTRPEGWKHETVPFGTGVYALGIGGLHSTESKIARYADAAYSLTDIDVISYYPKLLCVLGIYPAQIGEAFIAIYRSWFDRRVAAKKSGDKKTANSLKTLNNGTFGKLGSKWSIFYAPSEMIQVTVTGQLALLMLIETLELSGVPVVSANTDGIVTMCPRALEPLRDQIVAWWESITQFETERAEYLMLASRDVNGYIALRTDGTVKLKGPFAPPEPGPSGWPAPTGQICVDAVVAYLQHGTPIDLTVCCCADVRQFVYARAVKGGGSYCPNGTLPAKTTQKRMRELCGPIADKQHLAELYAQCVAARDAEREYLGKTVRWYYARGSQGCIVTPAGGLVARTDGCKPLMELPDELPGDVDYEWYCAEARALLADLGVMRG